VIAKSRNAVGVGVKWLKSQLLMSAAAAGHLSRKSKTMASVRSRRARPAPVAAKASGPSLEPANPQIPDVPLEALSPLEPEIGPAATRPTGQV
jgi:hypothetical protein